MKKIFPPTYFFILLILSILLHFVFSLNSIIPWPGDTIGIILIVFGGAFNIITDQRFKKHKTTVKPNEIPSSLITEGPFKVSRHPMYLGMTAILLGVSIILGSIISFIFPIIFIIIIELKFIPLEEKSMIKKFGQRYLSYKNKVRKWI